MGRRTGDLPVASGSGSDHRRPMGVGRLGRSGTGAPEVKTGVGAVLDVAPGLGIEGTGPAGIAF